MPLPTPGMVAQGMRALTARHALELTARASLSRHPATTATQSKAPRTFSVSSHLLKKGKDKQQSRANVGHEKHAESPGGAAGPDPFDFSELESGIAKAYEKLRDEISKLRPGGRQGPEVLEKLRIKISKDAQGTERLADVAQVIPRGGRLMNVIAGDEAFIKPITSAILSSGLGFTPQPDAQNPLQLNITLPTVTAESRKQVVAEAEKAEQNGVKGVRDARQTHHKKLRAMSKIRSVRPDDLTKAEAQMEKQVAKALAEVKKLADAAKKALESG